MARALSIGLILLGMAANATAQSLPSAIALALGAHEFAKRETERRPDPIPLRRVWLAAGRTVPPAPDGDPFRRMPRSEFERLVQSAARNAPIMPKLIRAEYRGSLVDDALAGTANWQLAADGPGAYLLDALKLALRDAKWSDGRAIAIGGTPAKLWIDRGGRSTATFAWSTRGTEEPGQLRFRLAAPAAPIATFELELPADRVPSSRSGTLLAGPEPRPGGRAAWRFAFGGETALELAVRGPIAGRPVPVVSYQRVAKYELSPGLAAQTCEFDATALRDAPTDLTFALDPGLGVTDVTAPGLMNWKVDSNRLTLTFREPFAGGRIAIAAAAAFPADGLPWTPPSVHLPGAFSTGDQIELLIGADLKFEGLATGDYRAIRGATTERGHALTLRGVLPADPAAPRRQPALRARGATAEFTTVETMDWRIDAGRTALSARYRAAVARGPLARLVVRVPPGLSPVAASLVPDDPTVVLAALGGGLWSIEPTQPAASGETLDVRLELRGPAPRFVDGRAALALANPSPVGASRRDGAWSIQLEPTIRGWSTRLDGAFSEAGLATAKYARDEPFPLVLATRVAVDAERPELPRSKLPAKAWHYAELTADGALEPDGAAFVEFRGRIRAAESRELSIALPPGASIESMRVAGKWVDAPAGARVRLPVPEPGGDGVPFELRYRVPPVAGWPPRAADVRPELPDAPPINTTVLAGRHFRAWPSLDETIAPGAALLPTAWLRAVGFGFAALGLGFGLLPALRRTIGSIGRGVAFLLVAGLGSAAWLAPSGWSIVLAPPLVVALIVWLASRLRARAAAAAAVVFGAVGTGTAQAPTVATVYCTADADRLVVFAPRSTLQKLADLAAPRRPAVLLVDAEYAGSELDGAVRFEATWQLEITRSGVHAFEFPLAGARLERMTLDGAPAFPDASKPGRVNLAVSGVGAHVLAASFVVPALETAAGREARCTVPDHPGSRLVFALPPDGRAPDLVGRGGARTTTHAAGRPELRADLGAGGTLALRWRDANAIAPAVTSQDATIWTLSESRADAVAAFLHKIERGSLSQLVFEIPPGLEAAAFAVRELEAPDSNGLKDWKLEPTPAGTRATLVLRQPARGVLATTFRLVSRAGPSARPVLAIPRTVTGESNASHLGVRLVGVAAESWQLEHLLDVPADTVGREFAAVPELEFDRTLARSLRREGEKTPVARPLLRGPAIPNASGTELVWSLGSRAELAGTATFPGVVAPVVECDCPPGVEIVDVVAADLAGWERAGNRLRAWFKSDARDPTLKWFGTWPAYAPGTTFELPASAGATVRVRPVDGAALVLPNAAATKWLPTPRPRERVFAVGDTSPAPKFQVFPAASPVVSRSATLTRTATGYEHRTTLELTLAPDRPYAFTLAVANAPPGAETRVEWPAGVTGIELHATAARKAWLVDVDPRADKTLRIGVVARFPWRTSLELPSIELAAANVPVPKGDHRLALPPELRPAAGLARPIADGWLVTTDGPVRLVDAPKDPVADAVDDPRPSTANADESPVPYRAAALWLAGLAALGWTGRSKWRPEWLAGYGALAASVAGSSFLAIALAGVGWRLAILLRAFGRRVGR